MTVLNISSKAIGSIVTKFHIEPHWAEGRKVCSNSPARSHDQHGGHLNLYKYSSLEPVD